MAKPCVPGERYQFTNTWFRDTTQPTWERELLPHKPQIAHYLEIGVCEGQSLLWVVEHILDDKSDPVAVGLDPYPARRPLIFETAAATRAHAHYNLREWIERGVVQLIELGSRQALRNAPGVLGRSGQDRFYDLIYIDGSHLAYDTLEDLVLTYPLLKKGGLLIVDDFSLVDWNGRPMTNIAIRGFMACLGKRLEEAFRIPDDDPLKEPRQVAFYKRK